MWDSLANLFLHFLTAKEKKGRMGEEGEKEYSRSVGFPCFLQGLAEAEDPVLTAL